MAWKSILSASWALFYIAAKCVQWLLEVFWYNHHQLNWQLILPLGPNVRMLMLRLPSYELLVFLAAAMISDLRHSRRRHWSHWLVLISTFLSTAILIPYYLLA